ncbi:MAG TPA: hypothetical protein VHH73_11335 [Verrucomicrobiae bacterium]|nr:hypothetical protein [Verrucomicrobiae bacterium]
MSAVSEAIVREFFELHGFLVRQQRKYIAPHRSEDQEIDFVVINPAAVSSTEPLPFVLGVENMRTISRAVVAVKGWHTEIFGPGMLINTPEIFRFVEPQVLQQTTMAFEDDGPLTKLLVVPALPQNPEARAQSIELLRARGIDAVIPFQTMLADLIGRIETNRNYQKSDLLQIIRILKNYDFFREPQLELFKSERPRRKS